MESMLAGKAAHRRHTREEGMEGHIQKVISNNACMEGQQQACTKMEGYGKQRAEGMEDTAHKVQVCGCVGGAGGVQVWGRVSHPVPTRTKPSCLRYKAAARKAAGNANACNAICYVVCKWLGEEKRRNAQGPSPSLSKMRDDDDDKDIN